MKYIIFYLFCMVNISLTISAIPIEDINEYRKLRDSKLNLSREVIFNNDGNDACSFPSNEPFSIEAFLSKRTLSLKGSDVKAISYCTIASGFGHFTHKTKIGEIIPANNPETPEITNVAHEMYAMGTDPLHELCKAAKEMGMEVFWSNRMNDTHDWRQRWDKRDWHWTELKENHPEYLMSSDAKKVPFARWSSMNFSCREVRDLCVKYFTEICENYDIDGIELDFFRHLHLFKTVAYGGKAVSDELYMLTDMMRRIRSMTEQIGMKKGKPILISIRIPDSKEYALGVGIDVEQWMKEGLFDILIGSDYFRLNSWEYLVKLGHKYNVKVYAGLSDSRVSSEHPAVKRFNNETFFARAAAAWQSGVDGLYIFNEYNANSHYLSVIGKYDKLKVKTKRYFATYVNGNPNHYLNHGKNYMNLPRVTPTTPVSLNQKEIKFNFELGQEDNPTEVLLILYTKNYIPDNYSVYMNNFKLKRKKEEDELYYYTLSSELITAGFNQLKIETSTIGNALLLDVAIEVRYN